MDKNSYEYRFVKAHELIHFNKNNYHEYSPAIFDKQTSLYLVDTDWLNSLPNQVQNDFKSKFTPFELKQFDYPHKDVDKCYQFWQFYTWYNCTLYDFSRYIEDIKSINQENIHLVRFQPKQKPEFSEMFFKHQLDLKKLPRINQELEKVLQSAPQNGYFVKLTQRSAKNQIKLFPAKTLEDVYKNLIYSNDVKKQIYESSGILLREWRNFEEGMQFRVLVHNKRLLGLSQQYFQKQIDWQTINFDSFLNKLNSQIESITFMNSFVIDVMYYKGESIILQFNPYGVYAASRSALFSREEVLQLQKNSQKNIVIKLLKNHL